LRVISSFIRMLTVGMGSQSVQLKLKEVHCVTAVVHHFVLILVAHVRTEIYNE